MAETCLNMAPPPLHVARAHGWRYDRHCPPPPEGGRKGRGFRCPNHIARRLASTFPRGASTSVPIA